ncbi:MAG: hypothetical protein FGM24_04760 [Candidatus Kapabacteria bacterium]|nr:hypothetical protein [Candidatus Kapabacteria bacterium]
MLLHMADPRVDAYLQKAKHWGPVMARICVLLRTTELEETLKWWQPCYVHEGENVLIVSEFKHHCSIGFFKGALINDTHGLLTVPGPNTQSSRTMRFTSVEQVEAAQAIIRDYVQQAMQLVEAGTKVVFAKRAQHALPIELEHAFARDEPLRTAFKALTPGRQNAYILHFAGAKQSATRTSRINACRERILAGKGLRDEY